METNYATPAYLQNRIAELEEQVSTFKEMHRSALDIADHHRRRCENIRGEIKQFVLDNVGCSVSFDELKEFAENCDVNINRRAEATVILSFNVFVDVPIDADEDEVRDSLESICAALEHNGDYDNFDYDCFDTVVDAINFMED